MLELGFVDGISSELESRNRILRDSIELLDTTQNVYTFIRRVSDLNEQVRWMCDRLEEGFPLKLQADGNKDFKTAMFDYANSKSVRLAKRLIYDFQSGQYRTEKMKISRIVLLYKNLTMLKDALLMTDNFNEALSQLSDYLKSIEHGEIL